MYKILRYAGSIHQDDIVVIPDSILPTQQICDNCIDEVIEEMVDEITPQQLAEQQSKEIIDNAIKLSYDIKRQAEEEINSLRARAWQEGYDEAFKSQINDIAICLNQTKQTLTDIQNAHKSYIDKYSSKISEFSLEIASSILKTKLKVEPLVMCDLVESVMSTVKDAKWAVVALSKELVPLIELLQSELPAKCPTIANLEIEARDISVGKFIVDSSVGVIDASVDEQIRNLAIRFEQIQQKRGTL